MFLMLFDSFSAFMLRRQIDEADPFCSSVKISRRHNRNFNMLIALAVTAKASEHLFL